MSHNSTAAAGAMIFVDGGRGGGSVGSVNERDARQQLAVRWRDD